MPKTGKRGPSAKNHSETAKLGPHEKFGLGQLRRHEVLIMLGFQISVALRCACPPGREQERVATLGEVRASTAWVKIRSHSPSNPSAAQPQLCRLVNAVAVR